MALALTATQNGPASNAATFGGVGTPTSAGDTFDTATYDVEWDIDDVATALGGATVSAGGLLWFATDQNTGIFFDATAVLAIASGGELRIGVAGAVLNQAYTAKVHWLQGASVRNVFTTVPGSIVNAYGDPDLYGSTKYGELNDNWTAGQTFYVVGDYSSLWVPGQRLWVHKYIDYVSLATDAVIYTIDTVGAYDSGNDRTPITIVEAAPGVPFNAGGQIINLARNIEFIDPGSSEAVNGFSGYTERIRAQLAQSSTDYNINMHDCIVRGWDRFAAFSTNFIARDVVFLNCESPLYSDDAADVVADFVSNQRNSRFSLDSQYQGKFVSSAVGFSQEASGMDISGDIISCANVFSEIKSATVRGKIISCGTVAGNTNNRGLLLKSTLLEKNTTIAGMSAGNKRSMVLSNCDVDGAVRDLRVYENSGDILPLQSGDGDWQSPDSGFDTIYKMSPNTNCADQFAAQMELDPLNSMAAYVETGSQTLTFKIWPDGWTVALDQDDILIELNYLDAVSGVTRTTVVTGAGSFANGAWRDLTVTFNPLQDGLVYFNLYLRKYEAGKFVLIDPVWSIA